VIPEALAAIVLHLPSADRHPSPSRAAVARIVEAATVLPGRWQAFARCVIARESHGNPKARNPHSSAQGKYQFLDRSWRRGLSFMVRDRLVRVGMTRGAANALRRDLASRPIAEWSASLQDVGFAEVITRGGWEHWSGGHGCNALVPAGAR
jgi:hypothetical protein